MKDKIKALLAKTVANGCTPEEATAASELAQKLMESHGIAQSELDKVLTGRRSRQILDQIQDEITTALVSIEGMESVSGWFVLSDCTFCRSYFNNKHSVGFAVGDKVEIVLSTWRSGSQALYTGPMTIESARSAVAMVPDLIRESEFYHEWRKENPRKRWRPELCKVDPRQTELAAVLPDIHE